MIHIIIALPSSSPPMGFLLALAKPSMLDLTRSRPLMCRMRYSRLLEENSFSNRRADYVWLLFLCATFLIVREQSSQMFVLLMPRSSPHC
jgi:hypothetical protein